MLRPRLTHGCFVLALCGACEAEPTNDYGKQDLRYPDAGLIDGGADAMVGEAGTDGGLACQPTRAPACGLEPELRFCSTPANPAAGTIVGKVKLANSAAIGGGHARRGTLLVAALPMEAADPDAPVVCPSPDDPSPPRSVTIACVDFSDADTTLEFTLEGVPPSGNEWQIAASLDVNGNGLDACDVGGLVTATVSEAGERVVLTTELQLSFSLDLALDDSCGHCE